MFDTKKSPRRLNYHEIKRRHLIRTIQATTTEVVIGAGLAIFIGLIACTIGNAILKAAINAELASQAAQQVAAW